MLDALEIAARLAQAIRAEGWRDSREEPEDRIEKGDNWMLEELVTPLTRHKLCEKESP